MEFQYEGSTSVMRGLDPRTHVLFRNKDVDGRDKHGHDGKSDIRA
jgi:hypothetical protein